MSQIDRPLVRLPLLESKLELVTKRAPRPASVATLQVGDLAKAAGKTVRAIHHYEELGLLKPDARSKGRFRLYDEGAVARVKWIGKLHDLGMSLSQIQKVLEAWESAEIPAQAMAEVRDVYRARLEETRAQIGRLSELERELVASIDYLDTCDSCAPKLPAELADTLTPEPLTKPSTEVVCRACELREREAEPDLVAGIAL
jgi:MerR family transcriptional regulator, copper efflux regulator